MSQKLMPRLGSAIASTILSYAALSLVGADKAQAAVLTFNFDAGRGGSNLNYFKVDDSSLTGIGEESIAVSEGRFYNYTLRGGKEYYNLAGKRALFIQGDLIGLATAGSDRVISEFIIPADQPGGPYYEKVDTSIIWRIEAFPTGLTTSGVLTWGSLLEGYFEEYLNFNGYIPPRPNRGFFNERVSYTLVNTEPSPVPEPLTAGGTALALAGLSWLKHKKKMAA